MKQKNKLEIAKADFKDALNEYTNGEANKKVAFLALTKAFEVLLEYAWKSLKQKIEDAGLEVYSPKDTVREAAKLSLIDNPELWIKAINARNESVHDYYSMTVEQFVALIKRFEKELNINFHS